MIGEMETESSIFHCREFFRDRGMVNRSLRLHRQSGRLSDKDLDWAGEADVLY